MSKFLSGRQSNLKLGVGGYTENKTVLETTGRVGIGTTNAESFSLYVVGPTNITGVATFKSDVFIDDQLFVGGLNITGGATVGEDITARHLNLSGIATVTGDTDLNGNLDVAGISTFNGNVHHPDDVVVNFGNSDDLKIYHDSNGQSYIKDVGTGDLNLTSDGTGIHLQNNGGSTLARFYTAGPSEIHHAGSRKIHTTSNGVEVTGLTDTDTLNVSGDSTFVGGVDVDGHTELDNLNVSGIATVAGNTDLNGNLDVAGNTDLNGNLDVDGTTELDGLNVDGSTTLDATTVDGLLDINAGGQANTFKVEDLTDNRIVLAGSGGELEDSPNLTYDGNEFNVIGHTELDDVNVSGTATITSLRVNTDFDVYDSVATIHNDLYVGGNISIGGTTTVLQAQDLKIFDKDIILGVTTDAYGNDISTDITANHAGVAVASTTGFPLVDLTIAGLEELPATYKKIMWFREGTFSGLGTDAWLFNYAVGIGSTQFPSGTRLAAGQIQITEDTVNTPNLDVDGHTELDQLRVSGVSTFQGNVHFGDSDVLYFGDDDDGYLYFDSNNLILQEDSATGSLLLRGQNLRLQNPANSNENWIEALNDGSGRTVRLFYNGTKKLETTGIGVSIYNDLNVGTGVTIYGNAGIVSATSFYGDGSNLTNTGATLSATSGVERLVTTQLTSGTMVDAATDADLTFDAGTNTLNTENIKISGGISTNGSDYGQQFELLRATGNGEWEWATVPGIFSVNNILNGFNVLEEGGQVGTAGSIHTLDFRGINVTATGDPQPNGIATITFSPTPTFDNVTLVSTDSGSSAGPELKLYRDSSSPADADYLGQIKFAGESDTGVERNYAKITGKILDASNGTEDGILEFAHIKNGSQNISARFRSDSLQLLNGTNLSVAGDSTFTGSVDANGGLTANTAAVEDLTENRLVVVGVNGELEDDANLTFDGSQLNVGSGITMYAATGIVSATKLYGDGSDLTGINAGAILGISSGTQRLVMTGLTSGAMLNAATDADLRYNSVTDTLITENLNVVGLSTFVGVGTFYDDLYVYGNLNVTGDIVYDEISGRNLNISGIATFGGPISVGGSTGTNGQYLKSTGVGVTWADFPTLRTTHTENANAGVTTFNFTYNVNFLDVFINGVKLTPTEYTASNGSTVTLATPTFQDDIVELVSYNTVSTGAGAGSSTGVSDGDKGDIIVSGSGTNWQIDANTIGPNELVNTSVTPGTYNFATLTVDADGRLTAASSGTETPESFTAVGIQSGGSLVGSAQTINFANNLTATVSNGVATIDSLGGGGGASVQVSDTAPSNPSEGDLWWRSTDGKGFIYYNDGNSNQWVEFNPSAVGIAGISTSGTSTFNVISANTYQGITTSMISDYGNGLSAGGASVQVSSNPPSNPSEGDLWWDSDVAKGYIYYTDGSSNQWVEFNPAGGGSGGGSSYTNSDVDAHLNVSGASSGQILSWNGSDYAWVADQTASGGSGISLTDLSVTQNSAGTAALSYNNSNGVFSYTPPDLSNYLQVNGDGSQLTGIGTVVISDNAPSSPDVGQLWWESDTATGHIYYNDGSTSQWVQFNSGSSGGGSGSSGIGTSRFSVSNTTGSIGAGTTADITITGAKAYSLFKIETSHAAWVRLYTDTTSRTNDASRAYTTDPTPGSGVLAEVYTTTTGSNTFKMTPAVTGWNDDATPSTNIYAKVTNNESTSQDITVTLTILRMED